MLAGLTAILAGHLAELAKLKAYAAALYAGTATWRYSRSALRSPASDGGWRWPVASNIRNCGSRSASPSSQHFSAASAITCTSAAENPAGRIWRCSPARRSWRLAARKLDVRVIAVGAALIAGVVVGRKMMRDASSLPRAPVGERAQA